MFRPPTPSYNSPPQFGETSHYEVPEWQAVGDHEGDGAASSAPRVNDSSRGYFEWSYGVQGSLSNLSLTRSGSYPQTPFEHESDRDDFFEVTTVSPERLSEVSKRSVGSIDYPLPPLVDSLPQSQYYMPMNAALSSDPARHPSESSAIIDVEYHMNLSELQHSTKLSTKDLSSEHFGPLTVVRNGEESMVLPGIVRDDPSKQNITYWIPLDPLTPDRHACISREAHLRGLHLSSIASMLNLFSNQDGSDRCPWSSVSDNLPDIPLLEIDLFESRDGSNDDEPPKKTKGKEKIKRPLNSFMIYRRSQTQRAMVNARKLNMKLDHKTISSVIGLLWQTERACVQDYFIQLNAIEKSRHQMLFPGYRFQPRRKSRGEVSAHKAKDLR